MATFIAIDVETANSDPSSICQIGIAIYQAEKLTKTYSFLVNPKRKFSARNTSIHGITSKDVANSPSYEEIFPSISDLISGFTIVSHTMFDRNSFQKACEICDLIFPDCEWVDSSMIARRAWKDVATRGYGLQNLCDRIGFDYDAHDAEQDAIACGQVVIAALDETGWTFEQAIKNSKPKENKWASKNVTLTGNKNGAHFGKAICFTGDLPISRELAAKLAANKGYSVKNSVSKKVDILIIGTDGENTTKHKRAIELQEQGHRITTCSVLQFFTEDEIKNANKTSVKTGTHGSSKFKDDDFEDDDFEDDDFEDDDFEDDDFEDDDFEDDDKPEGNNTFGCVLGVAMLLVIILYFMF